MDALYLLIRLSLRKHGWHRQSDYRRYADQLGGDVERVEAARRILCNYSGNGAPATRQSTVRAPHSKTSEGSRDVPIDLTGDSDDECSVPPRSTLSEPPAGTPKQDLSYHALTSHDAQLSDLLDMLSSKELEDLARQVKLPSTRKKVHIY